MKIKGHQLGSRKSRQQQERRCRRTEHQHLKLYVGPPHLPPKPKRVPKPKPAKPVKPEKAKDPLLTPTQLVQWCKIEQDLQGVMAAAYANQQERGHDKSA